MTSGSMSYCSKAHQVPVLPQPDWDLVDDQGDVELVGHAPDALDEVLRSHDRSGLALHDLEDDRRREGKASERILQ